MSCHISWCTASHDKGQNAHMTVLSSFTNLLLMLVLVENPGDQPDEAWIRMSYRLPGGVREHEVTPRAAADWSEFLGAIDMRELSSIAPALYRAAVMLGASK
ncbi:hypothetical protein ACWEJ6_47555 [Nonomuraea sp. NPDC004702]